MKKTVVKVLGVLQKQWPTEKWIVIEDVVGTGIRPDNGDTNVVLWVTGKNEVLEPLQYVNDWCSCDKDLILDKLLQAEGIEVQGE